jgi:hypothetical protein
MSVNGFIYTWNEDGDLVAVSAAHIVSLTYDGDELTLNVGTDEQVFGGAAALELLEQLIPDAAERYKWDACRVTDKSTARPRGDAGSARELDVDEERAQLIALLDDIERVEGCCRYLIRREGGDMIHNPDVANVVVNAHAKLIEIVERAQDTFGFFEDRTAANEQDETDVDGDELETMRDLQSEAYDLAAVIFDEMRCTRGGARARADVLMAQVEGLYDYLADAAAAFDDPRWDDLRARVTLDELYAAIGAAEKRMIEARRLYFNAGDWSAVQQIAREVLESLIALAPDCMPFTETARILGYADKRADGRAVDAVNGVDADKCDAAKVTDIADGRAVDAVNGVDADKCDAAKVTDIADECAESN